MNYRCTCLVTQLLNFLPHTAYAFYNVFIKKGSASIHPILGGVILQFVAALLGTVLLIALTVHQKTKGAGAVIEYDRHGILWSVCAGLAVGTAEMLSFCVSGMGVPASQSIPISTYFHVWQLVVLFNPSFLVSRVAFEFGGSHRGICLHRSCLGTCVVGRANDDAWMVRCLNALHWYWNGSYRSW